VEAEAMNQPRARAASHTRVLVLPLTPADGMAIARVLDSADIGCTVCRDIDELCDALESDAGSIIVPEESVLMHSTQLLARLADQPMWSELPIIILSQSGRESPALTGIMPRLGNVSVVERPMRTSTLLSLVRSNLRARERQYQMRDFLKERERLLESERFARSDAERAGRIKDEFLATLSHELRTPLNAVLGWTRVLRKGRGLSEELINGLTVIERNARSQAQIIGDLLDMSSIISGKVRLEVQPIDLATLIEATIETVKPAADAKGIQLLVQLEPELRSMQGDANRLQQVLWNLLANAVKFTPQGGQVAVTLSQAGSQLEVAITDNGEGIDPAFLPHIFERFRQADASSTRRHGGLGLGLSIVRQLVELHGGVVSAHSAGPGTGSTFRMRFPTTSTQQNITEPTGHHPVVDAALASMEELRQVDLAGVKILVVDDEPDSRALIERLLQDCHASVVTAGSADEAMLALDIDAPHLMVSDIGMPGTDGYTLVRRVRALGDGRARIPAIAVTAYVRDEDRDMSERAGFQAHLCKPVDPAELQYTVERLARRSSMNQGQHAN
jgi:signal transduction histidine kinase/ActR/RegA family two-component response regulator